MKKNVRLTLVVAMMVAALLCVAVTLVIAFLDMRK
jgi:hypothetical protein